MSRTIANILPETRAALIDVRAEVGRQIAQARMSRGWSINELASVAMVQWHTAAAVERGRPAALESWVQLAGALELDVFVELEVR